MVQNVKSLHKIHRKQDGTKATGIDKVNKQEYADNFVCMFQYESDAKMFYEMLKNRFAQFNLEIETSKTKISPFGKYTKEKENFDFVLKY